MTDLKNESFKKYKKTQGQCHSKSKYGKSQLNIDSLKGFGVALLATWDFDSFDA